MEDLWAPMGCGQSCAPSVADTLGQFCRWVWAVKLICVCNVSCGRGDGRLYVLAKLSYVCCVCWRCLEHFGAPRTAGTSRGTQDCRHLVGCKLTLIFGAPRTADTSDGCKLNLISGRPGLPTTPMAAS